MGNPQCHATSKTSGEQCRRPAMNGQTVCEYHGGSTRRAKAAAAQRLFEQRARNLIAKVDERRTFENPFEELLTVAEEIGAFKDALAACVGDLHARFSTADVTGKRDLLPEVLALERAQERTANVLYKIVQLGIEDRMVRVGERQAEALARLLDGVLTDLGHNPLDPAVAAVVTRRLAITA